MFSCCNFILCTYFISSRCCSICIFITSVLLLLPVCWLHYFIVTITLYILLFLFWLTYCFFNFTHAGVRSFRLILLWTTLLCIILLFACFPFGCPLVNFVTSYYDVIQDRNHLRIQIKKRKTRVLQEIK